MIVDSRVCCQCIRARRENTVLFRHVFTLLIAFTAAQANAADYPLKPVRIITAGVGTIHDQVSRLLALRLTGRWGQPVVVDNQPAAGLTVGAGMAARAPADGYTILMADRSS